MTAPTTTAAATYVHDVRAALADLPADELEDLLEDLRGHLDELFAEDADVDLAQRLGTAEDYAEELRLAAGLPARTTAAGPGLAERLGVLGSAVIDAVRNRPAGAAFLAFLPELRPAWWVLRAWGAVAVLDWFAHGSDGYRWGTEVVPQVHGAGFFGLLLLAGLIVGSVKVAAVRWTGWQRRAVVAGNVVLAISTPVYFLGLGGSTTSTQYVETPYCCGLTQPDGNPISNIYPYDGNGKPLTDVQLFDQNGQRIEITGHYGTENDPLHNVFPQHQLVEDPSTYDVNGNPGTTPVPAPSIIAPALPRPVSSAAATPRATPSP